MPADIPQEFAYIDWLRQRTPQAPGVSIGIGDDCASVVFAPGSATLVTTDMLLEGSCFRLAEAGPRRVGRKAMAVNLSDMAAMAAVPRYAVIALGLPQSNGRVVAEEIFEGIREVADAFGVAIVGGDTNSWPGPLVISITLFGEATTRGPVRRQGAKQGDWILVTGPLGGSILGKHLDFTPRVQEALKLHELADLHAMIDISDGLAADLHHLCDESGCGALLQEDRIPITPAAEQQSQADGKSPLEHALGDGEDFELLFTVSAEDGAKLIKDQPIAGLTLTAIGEIRETGVFRQGSDGCKPLPRLGYAHPLSDNIG